MLSWRGRFLQWVQAICLIKLMVSRGALKDDSSGWYCRGAGGGGFLFVLYFFTAPRPSAPIVNIQINTIKGAVTSYFPCSNLNAAREIRRRDRRWRSDERVVLCEGFLCASSTRGNKHTWGKSFYTLKVTGNGHVSMRIIHTHLNEFFKGFVWGKFDAHFHFEGSTCNPSPRQAESRN